MQDTDFGEDLEAFIKDIADDQIKGLCTRNKATMKVFQQEIERIKKRR